jgi:hypothetical protein
LASAEFSSIQVVRQCDDIFCPVYKLVLPVLFLVYALVFPVRYLVFPVLFPIHKLVFPVRYLVFPAVLRIRNNRIRPEASFGFGSGFESGFESRI